LSDNAIAKTKTATNEEYEHEDTPEHSEHSHQATHLLLADGDDNLTPQVIVEYL
jgi:hypothetical protein